MEPCGCTDWRRRQRPRPRYGSPARGRVQGSSKPRPSSRPRRQSEPYSSLNSVSYLQYEPGASRTRAAVKTSHHGLARRRQRRRHSFVVASLRLVIGIRPAFATGRVAAVAAAQRLDGASPTDLCCSPAAVVAFSGPSDPGEAALRSEELRGAGPDRSGPGREHEEGCSALRHRRELAASSSVTRRSSSATRCFSAWGWDFSSSAMRCFRPSFSDFRSLTAWMVSSGSLL